MDEYCHSLHGRKRSIATIFAASTVSQWGEHDELDEEQLYGSLCVVFWRDTCAVTIDRNGEASKNSSWNLLFGSEQVRRFRIKMQQNYV